MSVMNEKIEIKQDALDKGVIEQNNQIDAAQTSQKRFFDSRPILNMLDRLFQSGHKNFHPDGVWEICFCTILLRLEPRCKIQRILEALPYRDKTMDAPDFLNTMAHLGYFCRPTQTKLENIDPRLLPAVFIPENGQPSIILRRDAQDQLEFYDPVSKIISMVPPSFEETGSVWFFQPYDSNRSAISHFMRKGTGFTWFRALLIRFKGTFAQIMTAGLILNIIALVVPLFIMIVYDRVIAANSIQTLPMLIVGAIIALFFELRLRHIRSTGLSWLAGRLDNLVGNKIFAHLIGLAPDLIEKASVSAQIARIKTFESVRDFFSGSVFLSLLEAPFVFLSLIVIAIIAGPLVFVPVAMIFAYLLLFHFMRQKIKVSIRLAAKTSSARQQFTIETFEKLEGICAQGLTKKWQQKFRHLSGREMMSHFHLGWLGMVAETSAHTLTIISAIMTIGFGVDLIWQGQMSTGALVATMILVWRVLTPFYSLCTMIPRLEQLRNSIIQVNDLMDIETESEEAKSYSRLPRVKGQVDFNNVTFRYSEGSDITFQNLSFEAQAGDFVTITGGNGSGKATVLKLIKSLHTPTQGTIRIDGFDIRQLDAPDLRRQIAYVPKTPHFFYGSILENLRLSNPLAKEEEIEKALVLADAQDDIQKFSDGIHTIIGAGSKVKITSNLATKLSLARAYLHTANIILIDELPNTLLSGKAGENLKNYLIRAKGKRTVIMCVYREDYMALSDTIVWLRGQDEPITGARDELLPLILKEKKLEGI